MKKLRFGFVVLWMLVCSATLAAADVSIGIGIGFPNVSIGINLPLFPQLVPVPGYPVYYAPRVDGNYFFYDGMYWVYENDNWYASSWYNGPWSFVEPAVVPVFILRVPVRYYRQPPVYFRGWQRNAPPRWGQHWGPGWEQRRSGWNKWNRRVVPARAPLPVYQRQYSGDRYPRVEQQQTLRTQRYRYQPRNTAVRQHFKQIEHREPAHPQRGMQQEPAGRNQDHQRSMPQQRGPAPQDQRPQPAAQYEQRPQHEQRSQREQLPQTERSRRGQQPGAVQRELQSPRSQGQEGRRSPERRDHGQGQQDEERGRGRN